MPTLRDGALAGLYALGASAAVLTAVAHSGRPPVLATALLATAAVVSERRQVLVGRLSMSATYLPIVLAIVIGGPIAGTVVSAASILAHLRRPYMRWFVWTCAGTISASTAGVVAWSVQSRPDTLPRLFAVAVAAGGVEVASSLALATLTIAIRRGPWRQTFLGAWSLGVGALAVYVPMVAGLGYAYVRISVWALVIGLPPLVAAQQLLVLYFQQKETAEHLAAAVDAAEATNRQLEAANEELGSKNTELEEANLSFAASLIVSLDARDHYTAGHSAAVAVYSRDVAREAGLSDDDQRLAYLAGLMHDIGKVGLPPGILEKPSPLSDDEELMMQQHVVIGERIISPVRQFGRLAPAVRHHHERFDGGGYPDGLAAQAIPVLARIIAVADTYNAMTSDRPYRLALAPDVALRQLQLLAGEQLDPRFAATLVDLLKRSDAAYRVARRAEFVIDFDHIGDVTPLVAALSRV
jgi:HD-GYP domain-containing protein (c-di-GMP phosphodiesterase class II)